MACLETISLGSIVIIFFINRVRYFNNCVTACVAHTVCNELLYASGVTHPPTCSPLTLELLQIIVS